MPDSASDSSAELEVDLPDRCQCCGTQVSPDRQQAYEEELERYCQEVEVLGERADDAENRLRQPMRLCIECSAEVEANRAESAVEDAEDAIRNRIYRNVMITVGLVLLVIWLLMQLWSTK
jgi:hypothetical protein